MSNIRKELESAIQVQIMKLQVTHDPERRARLLQELESMTSSLDRIGKSESYKLDAMQHLFGSGVSLAEVATICLTELSGGYLSTKSLAFVPKPKI